MEASMNQNNMPEVTGYHWLLDLSGCSAPSEIIENAETLEQILPKLAIKAGMNVVGYSFHQFLPVGVTGAVILSESHLTVHTWPESKFVAVDIYVCNFHSDNYNKGVKIVDEIVKIFLPATHVTKKVSRKSSVI